MTCRNCVYDVLKTDSFDGTKFHWCDRYLYNYEQDRACGCIAYKPKTNADKIRSMTDEELAGFIQRVQIGDFSNLDYGKTFCDMCNAQYECEDCLKWYLKQTVK